MNTALIAIDGVLRKTMGGQLVPEGRRLYVALASMGQVVLLSDGEADGQVLEWLEMNGCVRHDFVSWKPLGRSRAEHINGLRREGYAVDLVVVANPEAAVELIEAGLNTLLFTHARYAQPSWRPDAGKGVQSWQEIVDETARQAIMKAKDERLRAGE